MLFAQVSIFPQTSRVNDSAKNAFFPMVLKLQLHMDLSSFFFNALILDFGVWILDFGFWILNRCSLRSLCGGAKRGRLDFGFWIT